MPRSAAEFAEYFRQSEYAALNRADMTAYRTACVGKPERARAYLDSVRTEHVGTTSSGSPYLLSIPAQVKTLMVRRVQIMRGNMTAVFIELACVPMPETEHQATY